MRYELCNVSCKVKDCFTLNTYTCECTLLKSSDFDGDFLGDNCPFQRSKNDPEIDGIYGSIECHELSCFKNDTNRHECKILDSTDFGGNNPGDNCPFYRPRNYEKSR